MDSKKLKIRTFMVYKHKLGNTAENAAKRSVEKILLAKGQHKNSLRDLKKALNR